MNERIAESCFFLNWYPLSILHYTFLHGYPSISILAHGRFQNPLDVVDAFKKLVASLWRMLAPALWRESAPALWRKLVGKLSGLNICSHKGVRMRTKVLVNRPLGTAIVNLSGQDRPQ